MILFLFSSINFIILLTGYLDPNEFLNDSYYYKNSFKMGSTEDLLSETGTYIIETDDNNNSNTNGNIINCNNNFGNCSDAEFEERSKAINQAFGVRNNKFSIDINQLPTEDSKEAATNEDLTPRNSIGNKKIIKNKLFSSSNSTSPSLNSSISSNESEHVGKKYTKPDESIDTKLLLGDTEDLINKMSENNDSLSTRAMVNGSHVFKEPTTRHNNGGLTFNVELDSSNHLLNTGANKPKPKAKPVVLLQHEQNLTGDLWNQPSKKLFDSNRFSSDYETMTTVNTEMSLGTRIQNLARQSDNFARLKSDKEFKPIANPATTIATAAPPPPTTSMITNRTLLLRQQSARAKRESSVTGTSRTSTNSTNSGSKLSNCTQLNTSRSSSKPAPSKNQPGSRSSSPSVRLLANQQPQHHTAAKDAFLRRKTYDPVKAVEDARIKQKLKQTNTAIQSSKGNNPIRTNYDNEDNDTDYSLNSSMDLAKPLEKLKTSIATNKQVYRIFIFFVRFFSCAFVASLISLFYCVCVCVF